MRCFRELPSVPSHGYRLIGVRISRRVRLKPCRLVGWLGAQDHHASWPLALATGAFTLASCTDSEPPAPPSAAPSTSSLSATPTKADVTPAQRASQLDDTRAYNLRRDLPADEQRKNVQTRRSASRADKRRFRLDLQQGRSTSVLLTGGRGVISCRIEEPPKKSDRKAKSKVCYLVSRGLPGVPGLFDPELQRLFRSIRTEIARGSKSLKVKEAKSWKAPKPLGKAECFVVRGKDVESGTYCFLAEPGPVHRVARTGHFP